jgi:hypothetical protein
VDAINSALTSSKLKFDVTVLRDEKADILSLYRLTDYGFIYFTTHGTGGEWLQTGELMTFEKNKLYQLDLESGEVGLWNYYYGPATIISSTATISYTVSSKWFATHLYGAFPNSFIYIGSCESLQVQNLSGVFRAMGAGAYFGYTNNVSNNFAAKQSSEVTNALVKDLKTAGDTYSLVRSQVDPISSTKPLVALGNQKLRFSLENPFFGGWTMSVRYDRPVSNGLPIISCDASFFIEQGGYTMSCTAGWSGFWSFNSNSIQIRQRSLPYSIFEGKLTDKYNMSGIVQNNPYILSWCALKFDFNNPSNERTCTPP